MFKGQRSSFRQLAADVDRIAKGLISLGVAPGEKVAIWLNHCPEWIHAMFACAKIGAVHLPVNTRFRTADVAYVLRQSNTTTLITHDVSGPVDYLAMARALLGDRGKHMLKIGGENVDPVEVEGYLLEQRGVQQVAVVGYPDPKLAEVAVAFVQREPGAAVTADEIVASCRGRIASFKIPGPSSSWTSCR
jgi:acyl-CoA synthetase (AMP-forming)/AMP-acid ligase II